MHAADEQVRRLERRLERERAARLEAEAIAERGTRELYQQAEHLRLLETVSAAANQGGSVEDTFRLALRRVCEFMNWEVGHVFVPAKDQTELRLVSGGLWWIAGGCEAKAFVERTQALDLAAGDGLPGRVWAGRQPAWVANLARDESFPRADAASACGLTSAFAFPVLIGSEIVAILEFYSSKPSEPDAMVLRTMAHVGVQLGRVIERSRNDARVEADKARLQQLITEADIQRDAAEAANRAKSAFLAAASHEVRTPLNAVIGFTEALKNSELSASQATLVGGVLESGARLSRLLDSILDMANAEAGHGDSPDEADRFWFRAPEAAHPGAVAQAASGDSVTLRILAAEDNAANRQVLSALLEPLDVDVTFAEDGQAALDCLAGDRFDLVLMDAQMPVMDGVAAVRAIRGSEDRDDRLPIFMVTANVFAEDLERYRQAGADGVIKKPIDVALLYATLGEVAASVHRTDCRSAARASTASAVVAHEQVNRTEPSRNR